MPGGFQTSREICNGNSFGVSYGANYGTAVVSSSTQNVLGSWTQLAASTPSDACMLYLSIQGDNNYNDLALNIGVGASGSEKIIANSLCLVGQANNQKSAINFEIPCNIPAGSRIAAQLQCGTKAAAPSTVYITGMLFDGSFVNGEAFSGVEAIGYVAASTTGPSVPGPTTVDVKGAYGQLIASTPRDYFGFFLSVLEQGNTGLIQMLDIAVGASGSEQVILPDLVMQESSYTENFPPTIFWIPIPAGTRIAARTTNHTATGSAGVVPLVLQGIY